MEERQHDRQEERREEPKEPDNPQLWCPTCSTRLEQRKCKLFCPKCGYYMSCADYY